MAKLLPREFPNGYKYRKTITVNRTKVGSFTGWFRTLLVHTDPELKSVANGGMVELDPLLDIRFENTSGAKLAHEIVRHDPATGYIEAWVRIDAPSTTVDTQYYMYFGKKLEAYTHYGIKVGYGSADKMVIERNYDEGIPGVNQGEATVYISGLKNPSMETVTNPNTAPLTGQEEAGKTLVTGFIMYSVQNLNARFGLSAGWNNHTVLVYYDVGASTWRYDNNSTYVAFNPVSTDFLIAEASWGQPSSTGRAFNYIGPRPAGEELPWTVWSDVASSSEDIGVTGNVFRSVLHMNNAPDSTPFSLPDSNRFGMNFGAQGSMTSADLVNGKVGKAIDFDGSNDLIRAKNDVIWNAEPTGYISMWFKADSVSANSCLYSRRSAVGDGVNIFILGSGGLRVDFEPGAGNQWTTGWVPSAGVWYHLAASYSAGVRRLYIDGVQVASQSSSVGWTTTNNYHHVQIGASITNSTTSGNYFDGIVDEFRFYAGGREAGFFLTEYNNQNNPSTFYSLSEAETNSPLKRFTGSVWTDIQPYVIT